MDPTKICRVFTVKQLEHADRLQLGFCLACGKQTNHHVEADAKDYLCDFCGHDGVWGAGAIAIAGLIRDEPRKRPNPKGWDSV